MKAPASSLIGQVGANYTGEDILEEITAEEQAFREFRNAIKGQAFHMPKGFAGELETLGGIRNIRSQSGLSERHKLLGA